MSCQPDIHSTVSTSQYFDGYNDLSIGRMTSKVACIWGEKHGRFDAGRCRADWPKCKSIHDLAVQADLPFLAHLLAMVTLEAEKSSLLQVTLKVVAQLQ